MIKIAIAGASGFVGSYLTKSPHTDYSIIGLTRTARSSEVSHFTWVPVDLFSLQDTIEALYEVDVAIYLVHSMLPSARLFQGNFSDTDMLLADNFAHACKKNNVKQIIYLGGLVPAGKMSTHLASRKEVEEVFLSSGIPATILRAGMVVGDGGSSFEILKNLIFNLPLMVLPKWARSKTQAIFIEDLIRVIKKSIQNPDFINRIINVVNSEELSYEELINQTASHFNRSKILIPVPINSTGFSKLWVKFFGETDYSLVSPLIDSLVCDLPHLQIDPIISDCIKYKSFKEMLPRLSQNKSKKQARPAPFNGNTVHSIQRLPNPIKLNQKQVSDMYVSWLPTHLKYFINVKQQGEQVHFFALNLPIPLLKLQLIPEKENIERVKFHIVGGVLSATKNTGWLEFRRVAGGEYMLSSVHEFIPALPWYIYKFTQAPLHAHVMKSFGDYLKERKY